MQESLLHESQISGDQGSMGPGLQGASGRCQQTPVGWLWEEAWAERQQPLLPLAALASSPRFPHGSKDAHRHMHTSWQVHRTDGKPGSGAEVRCFIQVILVQLPLNCTVSGRAHLWGPKCSLDQFSYLSSACHHLQNASRTQTLLTTSNATSMVQATHTHTHTLTLILHHTPH